MWRGSLGEAYLFPPLSSGGASITPPCPVSTSRLVEPDIRVSRILLSDGRRFQEHADRAARAASPEAQACSGVASSSPGGGYSLAQLSRPLSPSQAHPKSGPFPPPALPDVTGYYEPVRHPIRPVPHGFPVGEPSPPLGLPVLRRTSLYMHAVASTPARPLDARVVVFFQRRRPSPIVRRVGSCITFLEACSAFLGLAYSPSRPTTLYTRGFGDVVTYVSAPIATDCSNICRMGLSPTEDPCLLDGALTNQG